MSYLSFQSPKINTKVLTLSGLLLALDVLCYKISIGPSYLSLNLGFISTALLGYFLGPWLAGPLEMLSDFLNFTLFGGGTFAFPFLIPAYLGGMLYGMFLHGNHRNHWTIIGLNLLILFPVSLLLDTFLISQIYHAAWGPLIVSRLVRNLILLVIQSVVLIYILKSFDRLKLREKVLPKK